MSRSPVTASIGRHVLNNATHGVVVITRVVATTIHIGVTTHALRQTVNVVIIVITRGERRIFARVGNNMVTRRIGRFGRVRIYRRLASHTQQHAFPKHHVVPSIDNVFHVYQVIEILSHTLIPLCVSIVKREVKSHILSQDNEVLLRSARFKIFPIGILIGRIKVIPHFVVITIDTPTFDMNLQGREFRKLVLLSEMPSRVI